MTDKEGVLQMQPTGRWAVCRPGRAPVEVTSGEVFRIVTRHFTLLSSLVPLLPTPVCSRSTT
jgi:hypothetical protein